MVRQAKDDACAQARAVVAEETQNALDRAEREEETFDSRSSEPEGNSKSESGLLVLSNEPEDYDCPSSDSEDSEDELPLAEKPRPKTEFTFAS